MKKYHTINQENERDCGPCCISTILHFYKQNYPIQKLRDMAFTDRFGTSGLGIVKCFQKLGFESFGVKASVDQLYGDLILPCIIHFKFDDGFLHYVVLFEVKKQKKLFIISDPAKGIEIINEQELLSKWTGNLFIAFPKKNVTPFKETQKRYRYLLSVIAANKGLIINMIFLSFLIMFITIVVSFYAKVLFDYVISSNLFYSLNILSIVVIGLIVFKVIFMYLRNNLSLYLVQNLDLSLMFGYYEHLLKLPISFFNNNQKGDILKRLNDAALIRDAITQSILVIFMDSIFLLVIGILLYLINSNLFVLTLIFSLLVIFLIIIFNQKNNDLNKSLVTKESKMTTTLYDQLNGIEVIKTTDNIEYFKNKFSYIFLEVLKNYEKYIKHLNIQLTFKELLLSSLNIGVLWYGCILVINNDISIGTLLMFQTLIIYFMGPIRNLVELQPTINNAITAYNRLYEFLSVPTIDESISLNDLNFKGDIELNGLTFRYGARKRVIDNMSLTIKSTAKIAFVGPSGGGKSTIGKLLVGLHKIDDGFITINGLNINEISLSERINFIGYSTGNDTLFNDTILNNIFMGSEININDLNDLISNLGFNDFINNLPEGLNTIIEESGINFSSGERQKILILRTLIKKKEIYLLDELSSNLDAFHEGLLNTYIFKQLKNKTVITITHHLHKLVDYDLIFYIDKGKVIEQGTYHQLVESKGYFFNLLNNQKRGVLNDD